MKRLANFLPLWFSGSALTVTYLMRQEVDALLSSLTGTSGHWFRAGVKTTELNTLLSSWHEMPTEEVRSAFAIAEFHALLDTVFVVLLALILLRVLLPGGFVDRTMRKKEHVQPPGGPNNLIAWSLVLLTIGFFFDLLENLGIYLLGRFERMPGTDGELAFTWPWDMAIFKFALLFPVFVTLFYAIPTAWNAMTSATAKHAWKTARVHILASVVAVALAILPLQLLDVYMNLDTAQIIWLALTLFLGSLFLGLSSRILIDGDLIFPRDSIREGWRTAWYSSCVVLGVVGLATGARGVWMLGAILALIGLSAIKSAKGEDVRPDLPEDGSDLPRSKMAPVFFALIPVVALGVGAIRNTFWFAVYQEFDQRAVLVSTMGVLAIVLSARFYKTALLSKQTVNREDGLLTSILMWPFDWLMTPAANELKWVTHRRGRFDRKQTIRAGAVLIGLLLPSIIIATTSATSSATALRTAPDYGPLAIALAWATVAVAIAFVIILVLDGAVGRWGLPRMFFVVGFRHVPVVLIAIVWLVANSSLLDKPSYYDARTLPDDDATAVNLQDHLCAWLPADARTTEMCNEGSDTYALGEKPAIPLLLFAAEGGGIRAAAWTAEVLERVGHRDDQVFLHSGVSGGSVGFAAFYAANQLDDKTESAFDRLAQDHLSPSLAWGLFRDLTEAFIRTSSDTPIDRAELLERSFVGAFGAPIETTMRSLNGRAQYVMNSSGVNSACHILLGPLSLSAPAIPASGSDTGKEFDCVGDRTSDVTPPARVVESADLTDICPDQDMRIITAAVLSARFPFISPAGRIDCGRGVLHGVDGGYIDNTGNTVYNATWLELSNLINDHNRSSSVCVVPIAVQIDNGAEVREPAERDEGRVQQLSAPLRAIFNVVLAARDDKIRGEWSDIMDRNTPLGLDPSIRFSVNGASLGTHYFRLFPREQPGKDASLGWIVSPASKELMEKQADETFIDVTALTLRTYLDTAALTCSVDDGT